MSALNEATTQNNLHAYCEDHGYAFFEKEAGSSTGALFSMGKNRYLCNFRFMDLLPGEGKDFAAFEVHPGIHILKENYPMVAQYCQEIRPAIGVLQADYTHGEVIFKLELPITDNPVSSRSIDNVLSAAEDVLDEHAPVLNALAHGYLPDKFPGRSIGSAEELMAPELVCLEEERPALESIRRYLIDKSNHNIVSCNGEHWLCHICTSEQDYNMHVDRVADGVVRIRIGYGLETIQVDDAYRRMLAVRICKESAIRKVGTLVIDESNRIYMQTQLSLFEGGISEETMDHIETILIKSLRSLYRDISLISHGIIPESEDDSDRVDSILSRMRARKHREERNSNGKPDLSSLLGGMASHRHPGEEETAGLPFLGRLFVDDDSDAEGEDDDDDSVPGSRDDVHIGAELPC